MTDLLSWAVPRLKRILPLDDESLKEIVEYTQSLSKEAGVEHLSNILGDSAQSYEFIADFNARRGGSGTSSTSTPNQTNAPPQETGVPRHVKKQHKPKAPLHSAGPVRRPEGYGDVGAGYVKQIDRDDSSRTKQGSGVSSNFALSQQPEALQLPRVEQSARARSHSPGQTQSLMPPSASGKLISDLPNVRTKQARKTHAHSPAPTSSSSASHKDRGASTTTSSIADLTSAIAALELSTNPRLSSERRRCDCNASIHPLFATAPNCLNCGKIICVLEGLQPCSFCDAPILSREQVNSMIRTLKDERGLEKTAHHNASIASRSGGATPMFSSPDASGDESASRARAHRDRLLAFQRENAQRTKVHDEAADYDMTLTPGATQWMSATQRAAALKKQQAYLRELEEMNKPEWEKKKTVMSMAVRNGKLVRTYERVAADKPKVVEDSEQTHASEEGQSHRTEGSGAFSNNPLLVDGQLIRPVWKAKDGQDSGKGRERKSVWRRVQDDGEDNEQWILDGGLRGFGVESRTMEDGSQQECG